MAFICFITFVFSTKAQEALPDLFARIKPSVVSIVTYDKDKKRIARGSGFCIATNQIVTNKHVIEDAFSIDRTYAVGRSK
jgi:S1-C subfamily serine protease